MIGQRGRTSTHWCMFRTFPDSTGLESNCNMSTLLTFAPPLTISGTSVYQQIWAHQVAGALPAPTYWNVDTPTEAEVPTQTRIFLKGIWLTFLLRNVGETSCTMRFTVSQLKPMSHQSIGANDPNTWWFRNIYQINNQNFTILKKKFLKFNSSTQQQSQKVIKMYIPLNRYYRAFDDIIDAQHFQPPDNAQLFLNVDSNDQTNIVNYVEIFVRRQILYTIAQ